MINYATIFFVFTFCLDDEKGTEDSEDHHLNWAGPGREGAEPGPGQILPLSPHPGNPPKPPDDGKETENKAEDRKESGLTSVLDILEGRRPLGDPVSPLGTRGGQDHGGQQGEDSGIESMDTLSEKSPNQGESPFHAVNDPCIEGSRVPTYSSSMGSVSGKVSPPVSDSGSTDSMVTSTPPDKSPAPVPASSGHHQESNETKPDTSTDSQTSDSISLQRSEFTPTSDTQTEKPGSPNPSSENFSNSPKPSDICDSKTVETKMENSKVTNHRFDQENFSQSTALIPSSSSSAFSVENISNSQSENVSSDILIQNGDTEMADKDSDLIRSCDGADDKCPGDLVEIARPDNSKSEFPHSMHDYANVKIVNHVSKSSSNNSNSDCNIITVRNGERSPPPFSLPSSSPTEIQTIERRVSLDLVSERPPGLVTVGKIGDPVHRPSYPLPVSSVSVTTLGPTGMTVRTQLPLRPGAKMVPVKLVSVPGAGGRMVRVSPVKGGEIVGTTVETSGLPARTVVIKSSLLKSFSEQSSNGALTTCLVRLAGPAPASTNSLVSYPTLPPSSICDNLLSGEPSQPSVNLSGQLQASLGSKPLHPDPDTPLTASDTTKAATDTPSVALDAPAASSDTPLTSTASSEMPLIKPDKRLADLVNQTNGADSSSFHSNQTDESRNKKVSNNPDILDHEISSEELEHDPLLSHLHKSKTFVELTNGEINEGSDLKSRRSRNGKKNIDEENDGSLLRPLIAKDDVECNFPLQTPESPASGKRSRRDTGSSVQSDRSDLSILSSQSVEPAAKRVKEDLKSRRGSTSPGIREINRTLDIKKGEEKGMEGFAETKMDLG